MTDRGRDDRFDPEAEKPIIRDRRRIDPVTGQVRGQAAGETPGPAPTPPETGGSSQRGGSGQAGGPATTVN